MTGGPSKPRIPAAPSPAPMPLMQEEIEAAKKKVKKRPKGRVSTILAGQLMSQHEGARGKELLKHLGG